MGSGTDVRFTWGKGVNTVAQQPGLDALRIIGLEDVRVPRSGRAVYAIHVGDPGMGETAIAFRRGQCAYTVWLQPGVRMRDVRQVARGFGTSRPRR